MLVSDLIGKTLMFVVARIIVVTGPNVLRKCVRVMCTVLGFVIGCSMRASNPDTHVSDLVPSLCFRNASKTGPEHSSP